MSAIFGLVYLDGRPVAPERLEVMRLAAGNRGPGDSGSRIRGCAGLGCALLLTTPEARYEQTHWEDSGPGVLISAAARLDNRDELCDLFHIPAPERPTVPDGRLVALAHTRWGEEAPSRLFGDWSFAAWDEERRRLFVARDHLGNTGIFYCHKPPFFAFASTPRAILVLPEFAGKLDEWRLARFLAIFPGEDAESSRTYWEDVRSLPPAHCLTVTSQILRLRKFWSLADAPPVRLASDKEYIEEFLSHFRRSVRVRLRSDRPVATQLSAGLDSSSVTALAAEAFQTSGQTLPAFTSVPLYPAEHLVPGALADEWPLAHRLAQKYGNIEHIPIRAEDASPLRAVHDGLAMFGHPLHAASNLYWILAIHEEARQRGVGVLLTGQSGNGGISWSGGRNRIFFLLLQGRWAEGLRALRSYRERQGCSWYQTIRYHLLIPVLGPLWLRRQRLLHPAKPPWSEYSSIHPAFARRLGLKKAMRAAHHDPAFARPRSPSWERRRTIEVNAPGGYLHHVFGAAYGMDVRDPTADVRLLMYCFGLPDDQHSRDGGERMVVRRSMAGILPEELRWSRVRGKQAADVGLRLLDHRDEMEADLRSLASCGAIAAYVDCGALRRAWRDLQAAVTPRTSQRAASLLLRGIMAGQFIKDLASGGS